MHPFSPFQTGARLKRVPIFLKLLLYKVWKDGFHPVLLDANQKISQRVHYIHMNPVEALNCKDPEGYVNSSYSLYHDEGNYCGGVVVTPLY